ncbi:TetR/AcrR family transcriptional regulator [Nocardioides sp.]|uniref:TetR/AcrR family transcriptional regulator n=1 Tax=Nocardioides sp. TaxID=35761 RepID=UPI003510E544
MSTTTLRERRRDQLRREIAEHALALGVRDGWAQVTVAQIAEQAGISRRAFFTHFASKDDAVVFGATDDLAFLEQMLAERSTGASFTDVLRAGAPAWVDDVGSMDATRRQRHRIEREHPEVAVRIAAARSVRLRELAAPHLAHDLGLEDDDPVVAMLASSFAGLGAALDTIFAATTDAVAARRHVETSIDLLAAMVAHAAARSTSVGGT